MNTFSELLPLLSEGKVLIPVWNEEQIRVYQNDNGDAVFVTHNGYVVADSAQDFLDHAEQPATKTKSDNEEAINTLVKLPAWIAIDPSIPASMATGYTLFQLREAVEGGLPVSPIYTDGMPYCIQKSGESFIMFTPSPYNDIHLSAATFDELCARLFHAHFPFWMVGKSSAFLEVEDRFEREQREAEAEEAAIDAAPPRTIEVSEREYRKIIAEREHPTPSELDFDPFLPDLP